MSHFPRLPLVDAIAAKTFSIAEKEALSQFAIVAVQHLLETTGSLFEALIEIGFRPDQIFVLGKSYSTVPSVRERLTALGVHTLQASASGDYRTDMEEGCLTLWTTFGSCVRPHVRNVIILDEGGFCVRSFVNFQTSVKAIAIEQTKSGMHYVGKMGCDYPIIFVASCAVKKFLEPALIAEEVARAVESHHSPSNLRKTYGVLGVGSIGSAIVGMLLRRECRVAVYDHNESKSKGLPNHGNLERFYDRESFLRESDIIFGCTGRDSLAQSNLLSMGSGRTVEFVSCSSGDFEFLSLLKQAKKDSGSAVSPFDDVRIRVGKNACIIKNGGFPVNFTRRAELSHPVDIQLTRALLFGAVLQAVASSRLPNLSGGEKLSPELQRFIAQAWISSQGEYGKARYRLLEEGLNNTAWLANKSNGNDRKAFQSVGIEF